MSQKLDNGVTSGKYKLNLAAADRVSEYHECVHYIYIYHFFLFMDQQQFYISLIRSFIRSFIHPSIC